MQIPDFDQSISAPRAGTFDECLPNAVRTDLGRCEIVFFLLAAAAAFLMFFSQRLVAWCWPYNLQRHTMRSWNT
jgi:hypothetical protein